MIRSEETDQLSEEEWGRLAEMIERFEDAWQKGPQPPIDQFLPAEGLLRALALRRLVHVDLERRLKAGATVRVEEYLKRYPELGEDRQQVLELIAAEYALRRRHDPGLTAAEYLRRFPAYQDDLSEELRGPDPQLSPYLPPTRHNDWSHQSAWLPGMASPASRPSIPGYEIIGELGRGGMGVVYQARQQGLNRVVALKMMLASCHAGPEELTRFRSEAEAVARLQHPHIVQIYEIGEHDGRPFFSLEYMAGGSLARRLAGTPLPPRLAAELIAVLAGAIHAAHQRGIVHRDLKPGNVLLQFAEGKSQNEQADQDTADPSAIGNLQSAIPKITDFGLAKLLDDDTYRTRTGQIVGTPSYMAPEQALGRIHAIGPATDIHALGAILYELLTGRPPFHGPSVLDTLDLVRSQEPVPPSRLQPKTPRDLDTICLKCLRKAPGERYASAAALADDLRRFLAGEPVRARPVGSMERLWRWCRRQPRLAGMAAALVLVIAGSLIGLTFLWLHAEEQRQRADERAAEADFQKQQAAKKTQEADFEKQEAEKKTQEAKANLAKARKALRERFEYFSAIKLDRPLDINTIKKELLTDALCYFQDFIKQHPDDPELQWEVADAHLRIGEIYSSLGRRDEAMEQYELCRKVREKLAASRPNDPKAQHELAEAINNVAVPLLEDMGRNGEALALYLQAVAIWEKLVQAHPKNGDFKKGLGIGYRNVGKVRDRLGEHDLALRSYQQALAIQQLAIREQPDDPTDRTGGWIQNDLAITWYHIGDLQQYRTKQPAEALASYRKALEIQEGLVKVNGHIFQFKDELAGICNKLAILHMQFNQLAESLRWQDRAIDLRRELVRAQPEQLDYRSSLGGSLNNQALILEKLGRREEALKAYQEAISHQLFAFDRAPKVDQYRRFLSNHYRGLSRLLRGLGKHAEAAQATQQRQKLWPGDPARLYEAACEFAQCIPLVGMGNSQLTADEQAQRQNYVNLALGALRQALARGFADNKRLQTEKALDPLRQHPEFLKLVRELGP